MDLIYGEVLVTSPDGIEVELTDRSGEPYVVVVPCDFFGRDMPAGTGFIQVRRIADGELTERYYFYDQI